MELDKIEELDYVRGLTIIYIVSVIHNLYWCHVFESNYKSLFLIEMPVMFFITGAVNSFSQINILEFYTKRLRRIIKPYIFYALIVYFLMYISNRELYYENMLIDNKLQIILSWINPFGKKYSNIPYTNWHLWFISVYIGVMIMYPFFKKYYDLTQKYKLKVIPMVVIFLLFFKKNWEINNNSGDWIKTVAFYMFWTYFGIFYSDLKKIKIPKLYYYAVIGINLGIIWYLVKYKSYTLDMQLNKFPPNIVFLSYSIIGVSILYLLKPLIFKILEFEKIKKIIKIYAEYGYTMYLYQSLTYLAIDCIVGTLNIQFIRSYPPLNFVVYFILSISIGLLYPKMFGFLEGSKKYA